MCVLVCVCEREKGRDRKRKRETETDRQCVIHKKVCVRNKEVNAQERENVCVCVRKEREAFDFNCVVCVSSLL